MESDQVKEYELAVLVEETGTNVEKLLTDQNNDLEIISKEPERPIALAYPIKKHQSATLLVYRLKTLPSLVSKITAQLRFQPGILRSLIITPPIGQPSAPVKSRKVKLQPEVVAETIPARSKPLEVSTNEELAKKLEELKDESQ